ELGDAAVVAVDRLAVEEAADLKQVAAHDAQLQWRQAEAGTAGEAGAEPGPEAPRREPFEGGDGARLGERMAVARDEDSGADTDSTGALGDAGQRDPDVVAEGGDLRAPDALVAELLGEARVLDDARAGRQAEG